jgi:hypothetical protein
VALLTPRPALALRSCRSALALRGLVLLLSTRPRTWAFRPRPSRVSAAAALDATWLLGLRLRPRLLRSRLLPSLRRLLPHLGAARLHVGALLARS